MNHNNKRAGLRYLVGKTLFVVMMLVSLNASAQRWAFELWHDGRIVTTDGDTLKGHVKYDIQQDLVQYSSADRTVTAFSPRKVLFYEIFDNTVHQYRQFFALPYSASGGYQAPVFFELLADGKITLLCREALEYRTMPAGYYGGSYTKLVLVNNYFLMNDKGEITPFTGKKHELLGLMGRNADDVEQYMRENKLHIEEKYDFSRIISYYNSLQRS